MDVKNEIKDINKQIGQKMNKYGKSRPERGDPAEQKRSQVSNVIKRAFALIGKESPALAEHLKRELKPLQGVRKYCAKVSWQTA